MERSLAAAGVAKSDYHLLFYPCHAKVRICTALDLVKYHDVSVISNPLQRRAAIRR